MEDCEGCVRVEALMGVPETSENGRWVAESIYVPKDGLHKKHSIRVVNPAAEIQAPVPTRIEGKVIIQLRPTTVVYVRCETCLMSWWFDQEEDSSA